MSDMLEISTLAKDGSFRAYVARPQAEPKAGIVVIQEIFGVNEGIRRKCDRLSEDGYLAIAPDLFWRVQEGVELDPDVESEMQAAFDLMNQFDQDLGVQDIEATIKAARGEIGGGKVGAVGYCLGGRLAFLTAARTDSDATVAYYPVGIDQLLRESHAIANPLMIHIATADHFVDPETQRKMHEGLDPHPRVTLHDYEGLDHGFATEFGTRRNEEGATLADRRTAEFFRKHLG
jgi:carboxymethylenebutenolidase